ncbi:MAG: phage terminase small subunit-related protein [Clostridioides difficile]
MARKRDPRRDKAKKIWLESNGEKQLKEIASELNVSDSQIRKWKSIDKWSAD